jgi:hypothetical protein
MFITLFAVACLSGATPLTDPGACKREVVSDNILSPDMTITACMGIEGMVSAQKFIEEHPLYGTGNWHFGGWSCQIGNKQRPKDHET